MSLRLNEETALLFYVTLVPSDSQVKKSGKLFLVAYFIRHQ